MKKLIFIILTLFLITNCTLNKVVKHHGVHFLEGKYEKLVINKSNINDITDLLGPPLTRSSFDNDVLIYIEKKTSSTKLTKLGKLNTIVFVESGLNTMDPKYHSIKITKHIVKIKINEKIIIKLLYYL